MERKKPDSKAPELLDLESLIASVREVEASRPSESDLSADIAIDAEQQEMQALANAKMEEGIFGLRQDRQERKKYASRFFCLVLAWFVAMTTMLFAEQLCGKPGEACLSDSVLMTALGTTTATIVSILAFVGRYLFKQ